MGHYAENPPRKKSVATGPVYQVVRAGSEHAHRVHDYSGRHCGLVPGEGRCLESINCVQASIMSAAYYDSATQGSIFSASFLCCEGPSSRMFDTCAIVLYELTGMMRTSDEQGSRSCVRSDGTNHWLLQPQGPVPAAPTSVNITGVVERGEAAGDGKSQKVKTSSSV